MHRWFRKTSQWPDFQFTCNIKHIRNIFSCNNHKFFISWSFKGMASITNFCPRCNHFFLNLNMHKCRKVLMASSPMKHTPKDQEQTSAAAASMEVASMHGPAAEECYEAQKPNASDGSMELGLSYLGLLDEICLADVKATSIEDPRLALETFLSSNLSGE